VPDGALHRVNLATLPAGGSRYLLEDRRRLHYLTAERELARPVWSGAAVGMLALGNPAFDASPSALPQLSVIEAKAGGSSAARAGTVFRGAHSRCVTFSGLTFEALPAAAAEVNEVSAAWGKTARGAAPAVLTGTDATEAAFKALAPGRKVVHLASHGFFLGADCASASDVAGGAFRPWSPAAPSAARAENPLLLSGIALAGANRRESAPPDGEDGVLTAEEVGALDLSGTEWVVLSGCDTGIGALRSGEGVLGLSRAFRAAGARTLVLSLWPVDDESARQWMRALYDLRFVQRRSTDDAVRGASLDVLRRRRTAGKSTHPLYWGGFIATGDWR
jgi:CHAT domain-containing protein